MGAGGRGGGAGRPVGRYARTAPAPRARALAVGRAPGSALAVSALEALRLDLFFFVRKSQTCLACAHPATHQLRWHVGWARTVSLIASAQLR